MPDNKSYTDIKKLKGFTVWDTEDDWFFGNKKDDVFDFIAVLFDYENKNEMLEDFEPRIVSIDELHELKFFPDMQNTGFNGEHISFFDRIIEILKDKKDDCVEHFATRES